MRGELCIGFASILSCVLFFYPAILSPHDQLFTRFVSMMLLIFVHVRPLPMSWNHPHLSP